MDDVHPMLGHPDAPEGSAVFPKYSDFRRSPNIEDRRSEIFWPMLSQLGLMPPGPSGYDSSSLPIPPGPIPLLGVEAGANDMEPGHQAWLAERERSRLAAVQEDPNIHSFNESFDPNGPPVSLSIDKK